MRHFMAQPRPRRTLAQVGDVDLAAAFSQVGKAHQFPPFDNGARRCGLAKLAQCRMLDHYDRLIPPFKFTAIECIAVLTLAA